MRKFNKALLDSTNGNPPVKQELAASLVIGSALTRATEGLVTNNGTGALVVDVHVARRVSQLLHGIINNEPIASKQ